MRSERKDRQSPPFSFKYSELVSSEAEDLLRRYQVTKKEVSWMIFGHIVPMFAEDQGLFNDNDSLSLIEEAAQDIKRSKEETIEFETEEGAACQINAWAASVIEGTILKIMGKEKRPWVRLSYLAVPTQFLGLDDLENMRILFEAYETQQQLHLFPDRWQEEIGKMRNKSTTPEDFARYCLQKAVERGELLI